MFLNFLGTHHLPALIPSWALQYVSKTYVINYQDYLKNVEVRILKLT